MIKELQKHNKILCTSRNYREVVALAKLRRMRIQFVGRHGGSSKSEKLGASLNRTSMLSKKIIQFKPDVTVSFCSPEAARVSFGLGIRHVAFCDSPHADAVMRLSIPLIQKLLIPWIIPKGEFAKFGISKKDIVQYRAIDASVIVKGGKKAPRAGTRQKNILVRIEEDQAAYAQNTKSRILDIIDEIAREFPDHTVMVLPRYGQQIDALQKKFGSRIRILKKVAVGSALLQDADVFVGSGGTMTAESALTGIPTISYNAVPNLVQDWLVRKRLVVLESDPKKIAAIIKKSLHSDNAAMRNNAKSTLASMEDPLKKLIQVIKMR